MTIHLTALQALAAGLAVGAAVGLLGHFAYTVGHQHGVRYALRLWAAGDRERGHADD